MPRRWRRLEVVEEFPRWDDDATAYVERLRQGLDAMKARRDILAGCVFDDGEIAVEPDAPTEEYRETSWFVERLSENDTLE